MTSSFKRFLPDRKSVRLFVTYLAIGGTTLILYIAIFNALVRRGTGLSAAASVAYFSATALHFTLNRWLNFRRFERAAHDQARTFGGVLIVQWLVTLAVVNGLTAHRVAPTVAAVIAVAINMPGGFLANRYLTFGVGIVPRMRRLRKASK